jgi:hypothetical protein
MGEGSRELGLLSVVACLRDEPPAVQALYDRVRATLQGIPYELVVVDDGSTVATATALDALATRDPRVRVLHLSRSFGRDAALTAGLDHAHGDAVLLLEGGPPEAVHRLLERWVAGADVVHGLSQSPDASPPGAAPDDAEAREPVAGRSARMLARAGVQPAPEAADVRLLDRRAVDALRAMPERARDLRGMAAWVGFNQAAVAHRPEEAEVAPARPGLLRRLRRAADATTAASVAPLRAAALFAAVLGALALVAIPVAVVLRIAGLFAHGVLPVLVPLLLLAGGGLLVLAVVGEYLARVTEEVRGRPLYLVRDRRNLPGEQPAAEAEPEPVSSAR